MPIQGSRALLFERLSDVNTRSKTEKKPLKIYGRKELRISVLREVKWLLNTRSPVPAYLFQQQEKNSMNYGIPDLFSLFHPLTQNNQQSFCNLLTSVIEAYEPRLRNVDAIFEQYNPLQRSVLLTIQATLTVDRITEPMSFKVLLLNNMRGSAEVWDGE